MKNRILILLICMYFLFLLFIISCSSGKSSNNQGSEIRKETLAQGEEIFIQHCSICHGKDSAGDIGPSLVDDEWKYGGSDTRFFESIAKGRRGGMPGWGNRLNKEEIESVISYIKSIGEK